MRDNAHRPVNARTPGVVTREEIEAARRMDLLTYLRAYEPEELVRSGPGEYRTATHGSLVISNGLWDWKRGGVGGKSALDYLVKVNRVPFSEAVRRLAGAGGPAIPEAPPPPAKREKPPFRLPEAARTAELAAAYLRGRGVGGEIIQFCVEAGALFESRAHHNCVFVGRDAAGRPRYAGMRGCRGDFKLDVPGSSKAYNFSLTPEPPTGHLVVCESPIDCLSFATLRLLAGGDWRKYHYAALGGTSPLALLRYLQEHPGMKRVYLCLDNDAAGMAGICRAEGILRACRALAGGGEAARACARRLTEREVSTLYRYFVDGARQSGGREAMLPRLLERLAGCREAFAGLETLRKPPPRTGGKDYNEYLQALLAARAQRPPPQPEPPQKPARESARGKLRAAQNEIARTAQASVPHTRAAPTR